MVDETWLYSAAEMERMMKVQDVLLQAMAKKITWWAAAEIIGVTDRMMRRWRERLVEGGYAGLADRRKRKPSAQRSFGTCQGRLPQELRLGVCRNETQAAGCCIGFEAAPQPCFAAQNTNRRKESAIRRQVSQST